MSLMSRLAGFTLALAIGASAALALDLDKMTDADRAAFRAEVRAYLLENPEVLMEAIAILEDRQAQQQVVDDIALVAANQDDLLNDGHSWVGGNPEGDVTVVEFVDYRCGYCRRAHPEVEELVASDGNIRLIVKEFPILGEASVLSSRFAISAKLAYGDEAYKAVHDQLITSRGQPSEALFRQIADEAGLDGDALLSGMGNPEIDRILAENRALAQRMQISGTPTFVIGSSMLRGYLPLDGMRQVVEETRNEG